MFPDHPHEGLMGAGRVRLIKYENLIEQLACSNNDERSLDDEKDES
jgi:hypothetical protein